MTKTGQRWTLDSLENLDAFYADAKQRIADNRGATVEYLKPLADPRTDQQNQCLHGYCGALAKDLNSAGWEMKKFFAVKTVDVPWTGDSVKEIIWRSVQEALTGKKSSTKLDTKECSQVYETVARHMASNFGVTTPWPTRYNNGGRE